MNHTNTLYNGDNLYIMNGMNSKSVDLIYLDPPFNSKKIYSAPIGSKAAGASFKDMWTWDDVDIAYLDKLVNIHESLTHLIYSVTDIHGKSMASYLCFMAQRIFEMHRILKDTGSIYLHCDPTASHYLKIIMDKIFGKDNFRNEIIWHYGKMSNTSNNFPKNHDIILRYSKTVNVIFNPIKCSESEYRTRFLKFLSSDNTIRYGDVKHKKDYLIINRAKQFKIKNNREISDNDIIYDFNNEFKTQSDVIYVPIIKGNSKEKTGYPTQKPIDLLFKIIESSSNNNDIVFDPFCGCATTLVAAQQLQRKWLGIDIADKSMELLQKRLSDDAKLFKDFIFTDILPTRTDILIECPTTDAKQRLYEAQYSKEHDKGICNGCKEYFNKVNLTIDHIIPKSKGGQDAYDNYQLLCGNCNSVKGNRPMEYLIAKINARNRSMLYTNFTI